MTWEIHSTATFDKWFQKIRDRTVRYRLEARFSRLAEGNFGDAKALASELFELRFFFAGGLRVYYTIREGEIVLLLCAGDKSNQAADISQAKSLLAGLD